MEVSVSKLGEKKVKNNKFFVSSLGVSVMLITAAATGIDSDGIIGIINALVFK